MAELIESPKSKLDNLIEEVTFMGRILGRAMAQRRDDGSSGYDVLVLGDEDEIRVIRRILERLTAELQRETAA